MTIHANAIEGLSQQLSTMMNNSYLNDSMGGVIALKDISVEAFQAFTQFAYTGDYSQVAPHPTTETKRTADEADMSQEDTPSKKQEMMSGSESGIASGEPVKSTLQSELSKSTNPNPETHLSAIVNERPALSADFVKWTLSLRSRFKALSYGHRTLDDTPRLWILVDLYILATKYSIEVLRQKTLSSIHWRLCSYSHRAPPEHVVSAIEAMHFKVSQDKSGLLRHLCMRYAACQASILHRSEEFEELIRSNQDFAVDFVRVVAEEI
jgi:hypothetical protein